MDGLDDDTLAGSTSQLIVSIRSVLFQIYMTVVTIILGILALPLLLLSDDKTRKFCQMWAEIILFGLRWICGIQSHVTGRENIPKTGAVIAANHQSMWETMKLFAILHKPVMVLKEELLNIPIFGIWLKASGCIALDRSAGSKAMRKLITDAQKATAEGGQIIIFPEGTRLKPGDITNLKPGIAGIYLAANVPCLPVGHNAGLHWEFPGIQKNSGTITMNIAPVIPAGQQKKAFMETLTTQLQSLRPDLLPIE